MLSILIYSVFFCFFCSFCLICFFLFCPEGDGELAQLEAPSDGLARLARGRRGRGGAEEEESVLSAARELLRGPREAARGSGGRRRGRWEGEAERARWEGIWNGKR